MTGLVPARNQSSCTRDFPTYGLSAHYRRKPCMSCVIRVQLPFFRVEKMFVVLPKNSALPSYQWQPRFDRTLRVHVEDAPPLGWFLTGGPIRFGDEYLSRWQRELEPAHVMEHHLLELYFPVRYALIIVGTKGNESNVRFSLNDHVQRMRSYRAFG